MKKYITLKKHDLQELLETVQMYETEKWVPVGEYTCKRTKESSTWESETNGRTPVTTSHSKHYKGLFRSYSSSHTSSGGSYSSKESGSGEINVEYTYEQVLQRECDFSWTKSIENGIPLDYYDHLMKTEEGKRALDNKIRKITFRSGPTLDEKPEPTIREGRVFIMEGFETPYLEKNIAWVLRIYDLDGKVIVDTLDLGYDLFEYSLFKYDSLLVAEPIDLRKDFGHAGKISILREENDLYSNKSDPRTSNIQIEGCIPMGYNWYGKVVYYYRLHPEIQNYYKNVREKLGTKGTFVYKEMQEFWEDFK